MKIAAYEVRPDEKPVIENLCKLKFFYSDFSRKLILFKISVLVVSCNRTRSLRKLNSYLMHTASSQSELQKTKFQFFF